MTAVVPSPPSTGHDTPTDRPILEVDGVGKQFGREAVLKSASFWARSGRISVLMGRNGAGKTTLMRVAAGRVRADYGRILYRGVFRRRPSLPRMAREGFMHIAQESALTSIGSLRAHLSAAARVHAGAHRMEDAVNALSLRSLLDHHRSELSGGERQRASLALALIAEPLCLLMDEPFAGVMPKDAELIAAGLRRMRGAGCALVVSGHRVEDLLGVADEVIWVTAGTTHWLGGPDEARTHAQFQREYLGPGHGRRVVG